MIRAKYSDRHRDENRGKGNDLAQPLPVQEIMPERAQADGQNDRPAEIGEEDLRCAGYRQGAITFGEKSTLGNTHSPGLHAGHSPGIIWA